MKEILVSSNISTAAFFLVCCIITPILEETVYRGFLLASISTRMKWQHAVLISSAIFAAAHLSGENFLQLFIIGCVLGCSYCWAGDLRSSILIHSLYNSMTLLITFLSWIKYINLCWLSRVLRIWLMFIWIINITASIGFLVTTLHRLLLNARSYPGLQQWTQNSISE